jgi:hypothetical protein
VIHNFWKCPECGWVGLNEDGHCRQFDEHPDGARIPLLAVVLVDFEDFDDLLDVAKDMRPYVPDYFAEKWKHDEQINRADFVAGAALASTRKEQR